MIKLTPEKQPYYELVNQTEIYQAILAQAGTNPPTQIILTNTTGKTITWTRDGVGSYTGTPSTPFNLTKTQLFIGQEDPYAHTSLQFYLGNLFLNKIQLATGFNPTDNITALAITIITKP